MSFTAPIATDCERCRDRLRETSEHQPRGRAIRWQLPDIQRQHRHGRAGIHRQFASLLSKSFRTGRKFIRRCRRNFAYGKAVFFQFRRFWKNRNLCSATASSGGSPSPQVDVTIITVFHWQSVLGMVAVHQCHIKVGASGIITQRFRHTTRVAGLRSGDKRQHLPLRSRRDGSSA